MQNQKEIRWAVSVKHIKNPRRCELYQCFDDLIRLPVKWYMVMPAKNLFIEKSFWNVVLKNHQNGGREKALLVNFWVISSLSFSISFSTSFVSFQLCEMPILLYYISLSFCKWVFIAIINMSYGELPIHNTRSSSGSGRILISNPGKADNVCWPRSFQNFTAKLFQFCFLSVLWICHNSWLFHR